jgi:DNA-binding HxlR family transcriptional regulator
METTSSNECAELDPTAERVVYEIVERLADKWSCWILHELGQHGTLRFSRLLEKVEGVSQKMLTTNLRRLERDGLVMRRMYMEVPMRVEYQLTELGRELLARVAPFCEWISQEVPSFQAARSAFDRREKAATGHS